jgi:hypothetical protein
VGTLAEVRALLGQHAAHFALAQREGIESMIDVEALVGPPQIADGDQTIDSLLLPAEGTSLYVCGNLTVHNRIVQRFRAGTLVVFGSLRSKHVITTGQILVTGDLDVAGTLYGNCTNYATIVLGTSRIGTMISAKEHLFSLLGDCKIDELVDIGGQAPNFRTYERTCQRSTRRIDPSIGDADEAAIAAALSTRDSVMVDG